MCKVDFNYLSVLDEQGQETRRQEIQEKQQVYDEELDLFARKLFTRHLVVSEMEENCYECGAGHDEELLLVCDECNRRICHTYCAGLQSIPAGDWFCKECVQQVSTKYHYILL